MDNNVEIDSSDINLISLANSQDQSNYYIDEIENAIDFLLMADNFTNSKNKNKWKWISISLYHALYGFCICCLKNGNYEQVLKDSKTEYYKLGNNKWLKAKYEGKGAFIQINWEEIEGDPPEATIARKGKNDTQELLISFWDALSRVQDGVCYMNSKTNQKPLILTTQEKDSISILGSGIRNMIMHFIPCIHQLPVQILKETFIVALKCIEFLALESNSFTFNDIEFSKTRIRNAVDSLRNKLKME